MKKALLIIDHGSKKQEANDMIFDVVDMLKKQKKELIIHAAHMELADPTIADGIKKCIDDDAEHIIAIPYMLSPGRHATRDIPNLVKDAMKDYPHITFEITTHFGVHPKIADIIFEKAQLSDTN